MRRDHIPENALPFGGLDMTDVTTTPTPEPQFNAAEFASLGEGQIAYVRPIRSDEVRQFFPQAPDLTPGLDLFALLSASGAPILLADSRDVAVANAMAHDLYTVSLH
jgi:hypothetical protein